MVAVLMTVTLFLLMWPSIPAAQIIEAQWDAYTPPGGYETAGFTLFRNDRPVAYWAGADITTGEVDVPDIRTGEAFELQARFSSNLISPKSVPYVIGVSAGRYTRIKHGNRPASMCKPSGVRLR